MAIVKIAVILTVKWINIIYKLDFYITCMHNTSLYQKNHLSLSGNVWKQKKIG